VGIVTVGTGHHDALTLPAVEPLAVGATSPGVGLREVTLGAEPVVLIQVRAGSPADREQFHVLGNMTGLTQRGDGLRMPGLDVLVCVRDPALAHDHVSALMTGGTGILSKARRTDAKDD
jgi:hypothetical protein